MCNGTRGGKGGRDSSDEKCANRGYEITRLSIITWNWIISPIPSFCVEPPFIISAPVALCPRLFTPCFGFRTAEFIPMYFGMYMYERLTLADIGRF